ncbi:right-handed parallel beta-helix repeat-containing protein [Roseiflexus sp.]|uniref:right-handed parallel beta-helix repeat-containing protein n=1 Tax=Roseiflexus sp. TaxID=2562120 RepID=UPI0021DBFD5B|nr:right-handed parallel beta-helix repeat-containing protein [Roseiflexus sp.]GIW02092.1 MAG: membrane protein [Roseiflexus sp.]
MRILLIVFLVIVPLLLPATPARAAGVVGDGTPGSCTRDALAAAVASGGEIRFNCGGAPVTIPVTTTLDIRTAAVIDGAGLITLDGQGTTRILYVNKLSAGTKLALHNIRLINGKSSGFEPSFGGCVYSRQSAVELNNVVFAGCRAGNGAALYVYGGMLTIDQSTFDGNQASDGGAIYALQGGRVVVRNSSFTANTATGDGGALLMDNSPLEVSNSRFEANKALGTQPQPNIGLGGAIYGNNADATMTIAGSQFRQNYAKLQGGAVFADYNAPLTITNSTFANNRSDSQGGAVGTWKTQALLSACIFTGNSSGGGGGAVLSGEATTMSVNRSVFTANIAGRDGGALYNYTGSLTINDSSFDANRAGTDGRGDTRGGAIVNYRAPMSINASTFTGNIVEGRNGFGGAIGNAGSATIINSTLYDNAAEYGGAIYGLRDTRVVNTTIARNRGTNGANLNWEQTTTMTLKNTLIVHSGDGRSCRRAVSTDEGGNVQEGDTNCFPGQPAVSLGLDAPAMHGGPTFTIALPSGSPAIDAGRDCPPSDQRGFPRVGACDSGAFEFGSIAPNLREAAFLPFVSR